MSDRRVAHSTENVNVDWYDVDVMSAVGSYSFGMGMVGRKYSTAGSYRYSMNGQEKSEELNQNFNSAKFWEYDSRIGKQWNVDPQTKTWESPYLCFNDNPIGHIDPDGLKGTDNIYKDSKTGKSIKIITGERGNRIFHGDIKAGADLNNLKVSDFDIHGVVDLIPNKGYRYDPSTNEFVSGETITFKPKLAPSQAQINNKQLPTLNGSHPPNEVKTEQSTEKARQVVETTDNTIIKVVEKGFETAEKSTGAKIFGTGAKTMKTTGTVLNIVSLVFTAKDITQDLHNSGTIQTKHIIDAISTTMVFLPGVGQVWGSLWFVGNLISYGVSGKSISENIQEAEEGQ